MSSENHDDRLGRIMDKYINFKVIAYSILLVWGILEMTCC